MSASSPTRVLYVSATGLLQPLGYSQVVRLVKGLAARGWDYDVVSLERRPDFENLDARDALRDELARVGVSWTPLLFRDGARNIATLTRAVTGRVDSDWIVHARSYVPAVAALTASKLRGAQYVFDKRGYWVDEKRDEGRWFTHPFAYALGKRIERSLFMESSAVVSLSRHGVDDVREGVFGPWSSRKPVVNIPTCVDYESFTLEPSPTPLPEEVTRRLEGKLVVGYIGSLNRSYKVDEMCRLFAMVRSRDPRAHLLGLTGQPDELRARLATHGVDVAHDTTVLSARHQDMPAWLTQVDWGLMLLNSTYPKRASMPTKLAEFFAAGVRPIQLGCNDDVREWVARAGSGVSLTDASDAELDRAASVIAGSNPRTELTAAQRELLEAARRVTWPHFSLERGVERYDALLSRLVGGTGHPALD